MILYKYIAPYTVYAHMRAPLYKVTVEIIHNVHSENIDFNYFF